jgi:hypothetical protein
MDLAKSTNIRGNIVDGTFSTVKNEQVRDSVLDRLPKISIGFMDPNWKDMVKSEFKRSAVLDHASGKSAAKERRKLARDYAELLTEIGQHERLLMDFGWGEVRDERSDIRRTARRCGLELSDEFAFSETEKDPLAPTLKKIDQYFDEKGKQ